MLNDLAGGANNQKGPQERTLQADQSKKYPPKVYHREVDIVHFPSREEKLRKYDAPKYTIYGRLRTRKGKVS